MIHIATLISDIILIGDLFLFLTFELIIVDMGFTIRQHCTQISVYVSDWARLGKDNWSG